MLLRFSRLQFSTVAEKSSKVATVHAHHGLQHQCSGHTLNHYLLLLYLALHAYMYGSFIWYLASHSQRTHVKAWVLLLFASSTVVHKLHWHFKVLHLESLEQNGALHFFYEIIFEFPVIPYSKMLQFAFLFPLHSIFLSARVSVPHSWKKLLNKRCCG